METCPNCGSVMLPVPQSAKKGGSFCVKCGYEEPPLNYDLLGFLENIMKVGGE